MTATALGGVPRLPFDRGDVLGIAPLHRALQARYPVAPVRTPAGENAWLVTRYDDVKALLGDARLDRSHPDPGQAGRVEDPAVLSGPLGGHQVEQAERARMRLLVASAFSPERLHTLQARIHDLAAGILDDLAGADQPVDLHHRLSVPLPVLMTAALLGVPRADQERFWGLFEGAVTAGPRDRSVTSLHQLIEYLHQLVAGRRRAPGDDALSSLLTSTEGRRLDDDAVAALAAGLLFAGHEITAAYIDLGVLLLLGNPAERDALRQDPALAGGAVEEILRMAVTDGDGLHRYAHDRLTVAGTTIDTGDTVLLSLAAANRDGRVFPGPDRFVITRQPNPHLALGDEPWPCLGAGPVRVGLRAVFSLLFQRLPDLQLAVPLRQFVRRRDLLAGGVTTLPVTW